MSDTFQYNRTFSDNILVVGWTDCEKTSFVPSLGKSRIFGEYLLSVELGIKNKLDKK